MLLNILDTECRAAKRLRRQLERRARRFAGDHNWVAAWRSQLREYRALLDRKRIAFWSDTVECGESSTIYSVGSTASSEIRR